MGRSTDTFAPYVKLDLDPEVWPPAYWEKSRKCDSCETNWPAVHLFNTSPCCDSKTTLVRESPEIRWPDAITELLNYRFEKWYDEYNEGVTDEQIAWEDIKTKGEADPQKIKDEVNQFLSKVNI